ncbi:MAG: hypothetical protein J5669_07260 [Bacteroidales bacterium]|nr:hypothetical protein [Bacteroidales bacterium]
MKKLSLLVFSVVLAAIAVSCTKENVSGNNDPADINQEVGEKLFILNQGAYPACSTLDVLDLSTNTYTADFFGKANPDVTDGMGNTGNDMAIVGDKLWVAMNASNQVAILDPATGELELFLALDSPRYILAQGDYVYVTSYGSAVWGGAPAKGLVYRVTANFSNKGIPVGYQPEGLAILGDKLYVANSGGYNEEKDNTITVIGLDGFNVTGTLEMPVHNLNRLFAAGGKLWLSTYDTYAADYSVTEAASLGSVTADGTYTAIPNVYPAIITCVVDTLYAASGNQLWKIAATDSSVTPITLKDKSGEPFAFTYAYGIAVHPVSGDIYVADPGYFTGDSLLHCFGPDGIHKWQVTTGVGTGPLLVW